MNTLSGSTVTLIDAILLNEWYPPPPQRSRAPDNHVTHIIPHRPDYNCWQY